MKIMIPRKREKQAWKQKQKDKKYLKYKFDIQYTKNINGFNDDHR